MLPFGKVIFAGFFALTEMEKRIFGALMTKESVFFLFQDGPGMEEKLSELGISVEIKGSFDSVHPSTSSGRTVGD